MTKRSINLVLDWDGTITRKDTMFAMAEIASARDSRLGNSSSTAKQWEGFGKAYMDDFAEHQERYVPDLADRLDRTAESAWLKGLDVIEAQSVERVKDSGFFQGVERADVTQAANDLYSTGQVSFRPGWDRLFRRAQKIAHGPSSAINLSILSVNWSEAFIRASLKAAANSNKGDTESVSVEQVDSLQILANEIDGLDNKIGSSGRLNVDLRPSIRTSFDKLQHLKLDPDSMNVYAGDSATDFDCLLAADIGICIRDEPIGSSQRLLADTLARLKLKVVRVTDSERPEDLEQPRLFWARDLGEVDDFLSHLQMAGDSELGLA
jgi:thiamine phosphate phosphatase / amino-HMP aminohydrolase